MAKSSPPAPDYAAAAQAQGVANVDTAVAQSNLNNPNMYTPFGSQVYTPGATSTDRPTLTQTLSPAEQAALDQRNAIRTSTLGILQNDAPNIASALSGAFGLSGGPMSGLDPRYAPGAGSVQTNANLGAAGPLQTGLNFAGAPGMPVADDQTRQAVADAVFRQGSQYLDPQFQQAQDALTSNLANQGITQGSTAADRMQHNLDLQKQQAYGNLIDQSTQSGIGAMNTLFGEQMGARQQGVNEVAQQGQFLNAAQQQAANELLSSMSANNAGVGLEGQLAQASTQAANQARQQAYTEYASNRTMPINMLSGLLSQGQINMPQFQATQGTSITPPPIFQGAVAQGQQNAATTSANNGLLGGALGAGASILGGMATGGTGFFAPGAIFGSDRRLKGNVRRIGQLKNGLPVYSYTIYGKPQIGVMADEVEKVIPEAVAVGPSGFKQVNYAMLGA